MLQITAVDEDGELVGVPANWNMHRVPPHITIRAGKIKPAPGSGDRVLARLARAGKHAYRATAITVLPPDESKPVLGIYVGAGENGLIEPVSRKQREAYFVPREHSGGAQHGELVAGETLPHQGGFQGPAAKITERLGTISSARAASLIAIHAQGLPTRFSKEAQAQANAAPPLSIQGRADLRDIPLITIDGEDARDFDDAVFAEADGKGGFNLVVAIADVSHYVDEGSPLDRDAFQRGNSVYFPDRVIPMLPEHLSNGLCSLKPDEDRACVAVHINIDTGGHLKRYHFERGIMRSVARMTYTEVQKHADSGEHPLVTPLYAAYAAMKREREHRGALELNMPEYGIRLDASGNVQDIFEKERYESHRLIEAFMIAANVAAADFLLTHKGLGVYRVHSPPEGSRLEELHALLEHMGYAFPRSGNVKPEVFNRVLKKARGTPEEHVVNQSILRAQTQAYYAPQCLGHFGLGLAKYAHFTSPIRRYADLMVHREIVRILEDESGKKDRETLSRVAAAAQHISDTERKAMQAERDAMDRYRASYMSDKVGEVYRGIITGVTEAGLFITLPENGVTGFTPMRTLGQDFFHYDKRRAELTGQRTRKVYALGEALMIRVEAASGITGSLLFTPDMPNIPMPPLTRRGRDHKNKKKYRD